jgi:hypothetical protein
LIITARPQGYLFAIHTHTYIHTYIHAYMHSHLITVKHNLTEKHTYQFNFCPSLYLDVKKAETVTVNATPPPPPHTPAKELNKYVPIHVLSMLIKYKRFHTTNKFMQIVFTSAQVSTNSILIVWEYFTKVHSHKRPWSSPKRGSYILRAS